MAKTIIGRSEQLVLVGLSDQKIPAKIDTGAFTSAIHTEDIHLGKNGNLTFCALKSHPACPVEIRKTGLEISTKIFEKIYVENSFGTGETRYKVPLKVKLGGKILEADFSLANRRDKTFPILIGRKLLNGNFLVDSELSNIDRQTLKDKIKQNEEETI